MDWTIKTYRLQLCTRGTDLRNAGLWKAGYQRGYADQISFDERDKCTVIRSAQQGERYNRFETEADDEVHLGVTILKNTAKRLDYRFDGENNFYISNYRRETT